MRRKQYISKARLPVQGSFACNAITGAEIDLIFESAQ